MSVLSIGPGASVAVHSLAINPVERNSKVATVSFHTVPVSLYQGSKDQWKFALPPEGDEDTVDTTHTLILDTHFSGFTPLQHSEEDSCDVDVIAISGLGGHAFGSFKERGGSFMWLRDALPLDFPNARILIYGYDSRLVRSSSFQNLTDLGRALQIDMNSIRESSQSRPIVFIGHSLGGLVIKEAICKLKEEMDETGASILNATCGFLFFGVPHQGMAIESLVPLVKDQPNRGLLESLGKNSALLTRLGQDFGNAFGERHIPIISFYETEKSPTAVKRNGRWELSGPLSVLVDVSSATCGSKNQHPIGRCHSEMVKYSDQYDALYQRVRTALRPLLLKARNTRDIVTAEAGNNSLVPHPTKSLVNTCGWLLDDPQYKHWMNKPRGLFWIKGNPGTGKSVLMKFAAQAMARRKSGQLVISYFLHGRGTLLQKTPLGVFRALLNCMLNIFPTYLSELTAQFEDREKRFGSYEEGRWTWTEKELQEFLFRVLTKGTKAHPVVIFVDALDETGKDAARSLLSYFRDMMRDVERDKGLVKICVSSRHYPILGLDIFPTTSVEERNDQDIRLVIRNRLEQVQPDSKRQQIENQILLKAQGGFQWAVLVSNMVIEENDNGTKADILQEKIVSIPEALDELYASILCSVPETERQQTVKLFQWVLFTARPLSAQELRDALSIDKGMQCTTDIRKHSSWSDTLLEFERHAKHLSRGLIEFQSRELWEQYGPDGEDPDREAQLIHQSVADYLLKNFLSHVEHDQSISQSPVAAGHFQISRSCVRYLTLEEVLEEAQWRPSQLRIRFPLVPYAVRFLLHHIQEVEGEGIAQSDLLSLIQSDRQPNMQRIGSVWSVSDPDCIYAPIGWPFAEATALHVLIALGSKSAFDEFLQKDNVQFNGRDAEGNTPLLLAIREDKQDMALALLNRSIEWRLRQNEDVEQSIDGAKATELEKSYLVDINTENNDGETPLTVALTNNTGEVVYALLEAGADPKFLGQESALISYAIRNRDEPLLMKLTEKKVKLDGAVHLALKEIKDNEDLLKRVILELLQAGANTTRLPEFDRDIGTPSADETHDGYEHDDEAILLASRSGQTAIVNLLLLYGVSATSQDRYGDFPLLVAMKKGHKEIVEILLQAEPAAVEMEGNRGQQALITAIDQDEVEIAMLLIQKGSFHPSTAALREGLSKAIEKDMSDLVDIILRKDKGLVQIEIASDQTPLSFAAENGSEAVVKLLLEAGANMESEDNYNQTPLYLAALHGREAVVKLLLEAGANMESKNTYDRTPLYQAALNGHEAVVKLLLEAGASLESKDINQHTPLILAAKRGREAAVKLLLQAGTNLEAKDTLGRTPLSYAACNGHKAVVKLLLGAGANPESKDVTKQTPLLLAAESGHEAVVRLLLRAGTDLELKGILDQTPLSRAAWSGHNAVIRLLLKTGANPESKDVDDRTPLLLAAERGHEAAVKLLLQAGANLESNDSVFHQTPLSRAAWSGHEAVVKVLLEAGANPEAKDIYNWTPLLLAAKRHKGVVQLLLKAGANPKSMDISRSAPLSWSSSEGE
ncbi:ankyrin-1 [Aspergillus lentulus]|uniref:Ankyrin-1 n=1 Tax=Aspergillus lentulus TaxID=293939 RepID=A0ABQ1A0B1_ASPLE|nr:ankyrin-1 [Aspergillus lentulus]